jgi:hypothetical protein
VPGPHDPGDRVVDVVEGEEVETHAAWLRGVGVSAVTDRASGLVGV